MRRILVIRHESAGCMNNMRALAKELGKGHEVQIEYADLVLRNKVLIPSVLLLIRLLAIIPQSAVQTLALTLFKGDLPPRHEYDVIISTLGTGEAPSVLLSACYPYAIHIHIGTPRRIARRYFDVIIANFGIEPKKDEIMLGHALTRLDVETGDQPEDEGLDLHGDIAALLVGGTATDVNFGAQYWADMLAFIPAYAAQQKIRWVITTTPRTPVDVMNALQKLADENPAIIAHYSAYRADGISYLHTYLHACKAAFVTAESVSMIADAMVYPVPVFAVGNPDMIKNKRINGFLDMQRKQNTIQYVNMCDIRDGAVPPYTALVHRRKWSESFWAQLTQFYPAAAEKLKTHANSCDR